jgi:ADP-heptose:LPS heptosyltransferase
LTYSRGLSIIFSSQEVRNRGIMAADELHCVHGGNILVVHQGALGDLIVALPAVRTLREFLLPAQLDMMGHPRTLALIHGHPYADNIIDINRGEMAPFFHEAAILPSQICAYLRRFAAAFYFGQSTIFADNLRRAGVGKTFRLPPFLAGRTHAIDHYLSSLNALGISSIYAQPMIYLRNEELKKAREFFYQTGWDLNGIICLHPGAGSRKKAWPTDRFAAVATALARKSHKILIVQGPADEAATEEVIAYLGSTPYLLIYSVPLTQLAALMSYASLFLGNDSGISHLAAALGVPTIAIFGPTDPLCWAPRGAKAFWLQGQAACTPCTRDEQHLCERQQCLEGIQVEQVIALIAEKEMISALGAFPEERSIMRQKYANQLGESRQSLSPS